MTDNLKPAFDGIRAEETLKKNTRDFLRKEIAARDGKTAFAFPGYKKKSRAALRRLVPALASAAAVLVLGLFSYGFYFTPVSYIDMDVNPSVEIVLNRFDRVIDTGSYNAEGEAILEKTNVKHKSYDDAVGLLVDAMVQSGYAKDAGLISVTLQTDGKETEPLMLSNIRSAVRAHHSTAQIDAFPIGGHVLDAAHSLNLSPAKYLAIQDLIDVDPTATVDGCRGHSIGELKALTAEHSGGHHRMGHHGMGHN